MKSKEEMMREVYWAARAFVYQTDWELLGCSRCGGGLSITEEDSKQRLEEWLEYFDDVYGNKN